MPRGLVNHSFQEVLYIFGIKLSINIFRKIQHSTHPSILPMSNLIFWGIHLTDVTPIYCGLGVQGSATDLLCQNRLNGCRLLDHAVKQLATRTGCPAVKPEGEFVEIAIQMRRAHSTLIGPQQPAFEQCHNPVDAGQQVSTDVSSLSDNFVSVANFGQSPIASPSIRVDNAARLDTVLDGPFQAWCRPIPYTPEADAPDLAFCRLDHDNNQHFPRRPSTALARLFSSYVRFVHLNGARQTVSSWPHHRPPQLVQPRPCYVIAAHTKHTLQSQRVRAIFLAGQVPDGTKPEAERLLGVLKDSPGYDRCPVPAVDTLEQRSPYRPSFFMAAPRATKSVRPAHLIQIVSARFFPRKTGLEFHQTSRIVLHDSIYYRLGLHQSSGYPKFLIHGLHLVSLR